MKTDIVQVEAKLCPRQRDQQAFTLIEIMVAMAIFSLLMLGTIYGNLFGLRMREITSAKLGASDEARQAISQLAEEIRAAAWIRIGEGTTGNFVEAPPLTEQKGNAIQIYPLLNNTNLFVTYFWETNRLKRIENGEDAIYVVANSISNNVVFTSEDFQGNVLLTQAKNRVIGLTLQFYQLQFPSVAIGPGNYYDFYQLRTRITRRSAQ